MQRRPLATRRRKGARCPWPITSITARPSTRASAISDADPPRHPLRKERRPMARLLVRSIAAVGVALILVVGTVLATSGPPAGHDHDTANPAAARGPVARDTFHDAMRVLWEDHITWTRLAIVSLATGSPDTQATVARLLKNQTDIGNAVKPYYGKAAGDKLTAELRKHILIAADLIAAAKAGKQAELA